MPGKEDKTTLTTLEEAQSDRTYCQGNNNQSIFAEELSPIQNQILRVETRLQTNSST